MRDIPLSGLAFAAAFVLAGPAAARELNDTGATRCLDGTTGLLTSTCAGTGQDADFGRDVTALNPSNGHAGFKFQKIDITGAPLPKRATTWACVKDQVTGLIWENKTTDGGPQDKDRLFTNFRDGGSGDASNFVDNVNAKGLCGARDWRLPTLVELQSLVNFDAPNGEPALDLVFFPTGALNFHWTSTVSYDNNSHWLVDFNSGLGGDAMFPNRFTRPVRLVHGRLVDTVGGRFVTSGDEATDPATGLIWRRCSEGQAWTGDNCVGELATYRFIDTFDHAKAEALRTGLGWRVPNAKEMSTIADRRQQSPAIDLAVFPGTPGMWTYWTSTPFVPDPSRAFSHLTYAGYSSGVSHVVDLHSLRLVRDAP